MEEEKKTIKVQNNLPDPGAIFWIMGWLFSLGLLKYSFWHAVLAIILWPYYVGDFVSSIVK
jgi:hypothetical protein